jgi:hypothetical protein
MAVHLARLYTHTVIPEAAAGRARDVLDNAYRQAFCDHGTRMQYFAEIGASRHDLTHQFTVIRQDLADLWRRAQAANRRHDPQRAARGMPASRRPDS